ALCRAARDGTRRASVHAHFLRPVLGGRAITFHSDVVKAGRTFCVHRVTATQDDKAAITMMCSFTADTEGYVYDLSGLPDEVPLPDGLPEPEPDDGEPGPWDTR